jgi:hypothetical protein
LKLKMRNSDGQIDFPLFLINFQINYGETIVKNGVKNLFDDLVQQGAILQTSLVGCTAQEIASIEQHFSDSLPVAYHDFLSIAGRSAGKLFRGTDVFYPRVLELQSEAREVLNELGLPNLLPIDAKIFCMHQGYEINYFLPISDDPPVYQFFEGQSSTTRPWNSFTEFMKNSIEDHLAQWRDLN